MIICYVNHKIYVPYTSLSDVALISCSTLSSLKHIYKHVAHNYILPQIIYKEAQEI